MQHPDPETLSLLALNEPLDDEQAMEHLRSCPECAAEYAALRRAVSAVRTTPDTSNLERPGPNVWAGIHSELGLSGAVAQDPLESAAAETGPSETGPSETGPSETGPAKTGPAEPRTAETRPAAPSRPRSGNVTWLRRPGVWLAAAAALVVAAGIACLLAGRLLRWPRPNLRRWLSTRPPDPPRSQNRRTVRAPLRWSSTRLKPRAIRKCG